MANLNFIKKTLGILETNKDEYFKFGVDDEKKAHIQKLLDERDVAKKEGNYTLADEIRSSLLKDGISIMDTPNGTLWEKV